MALYRLHTTPRLTRPTLIAAFDGWIDAGSASTTAAGHIGGDGDIVAGFDDDVLIDYRSRRPTLEIVDGRMSQLTWPEISIRHARPGGRDVLVLSGAEPDFRWHEFTTAVLEIIERFEVREWISLGAIPAAVPHTRPVPIIGTASAPGLLKGDVRPGPDGLLRVPAAALSVLEMAVSRSGTPSVGYFAQVPHYVSGPYALAAAELVKAVGRHLDVDIPAASLIEEGRALRDRLDAATDADESTRSYVERLEAMVDEERAPAGDELIAEIERFLRDRGGEGTQRS